MRRKWSPQQIAGWLKRQHPDEEQHRVSNEAIYRSLYVQTRGVIKKNCSSVCAARAPFDGHDTLTKRD